MNHREWGWGLPGRCIFLVVLIAALPFSKVLAEGDDGEASARNENEPFPPGLFFSGSLPPGTGKNGH